MCSFKTQKNRPESGGCSREFSLGQGAADLAVSRQMRELLQEPLSSLEARLDPIHLPDEPVAEYL